MCNDGAMSEGSVFEALLAEGLSASTQGWDFSWLNGRASEGRPSWKYLVGLTERVGEADSVLDIQTGGGEKFAEALSRSTRLPEFVAATEFWPPNLTIARRVLAPYGAHVSGVADNDPLPFNQESFDLACSRHPTVINWEEIHRVLKPGGTYFSQQIGAGTNSELTDFLMGPQPWSVRQRLEVAVADARSAGLDVIDAREESLPVRFYDVGAVVYFLRKVIWTVPDFSVEKYRDRLIVLHEKIERDGHFGSHSQRSLLEVRKPAL